MSSFTGFRVINTRYTNNNIFSLGRNTLFNSNAIRNIPICNDFEYIIRSGDTIIYDGSEFISGNLDGSTGYTGVQGVQGEIGPTGYTGPQGVQGEIGPQGVQGEIGPTGYTGPQGIQGNTGPTGFQDSIFYIESESESKTTSISL